MIGFKDVQSWWVSCYDSTNVPQKRNISINTCSAISYQCNTSFRFHFTCFASTDASAFKLYLVFWKAVNIILVCLVLLSSAWMENNPLETLWIFFFPTKIQVHSQLTISSILTGPGSLSSGTFHMKNEKNTE